MARRTIAMAFITALLAGLIGAAPAGAGSADNQCWTYKTPEKRFARRINSARVNANLGRLKRDPELSKAARVHTRKMIKENELFHTPSATLRQRVTDWIVLGENVGVGGTVASLHKAFMNSPGHRDNIMGLSYRYVGVGVKRANGRMWVTVVFSGVSNPGTTLSMPKC